MLGRSSFKVGILRSCCLLLCFKPSNQNPIRARDHPTESRVGSTLNFWLLLWWSQGRQRWLRIRCPESPQRWRTARGVSGETPCGHEALGNQRTSAVISGC
ncbi:hypothetical protein BDV12DRAFT_165589, partial [Aspergillus spectabilis]